MLQKSRFFKSGSGIILFALGELCAFTGFIDGFSLFKKGLNSHQLSHNLPEYSDSSDIAPKLLKVSGAGE